MFVGVDGLILFCRVVFHFWISISRMLCLLCFGLLFVTISGCVGILFVIGCFGILFVGSPILLAFFPVTSWFFPRDICLVVIRCSVELVFGGRYSCGSIMCCRAIMMAGGGVYLL